MTNTASRLLRALCSMAGMLAMAAGISAMPALAASNGIYTATAASHYKHPTTGVIEDAGGEGSYVLGQSMTDSALNKSALVEVDAAGNTFVTIRLNLMDNIQEPQFQVDGSRNGTFTPVSAAVMQEDFTNNTTDFRLQVPGENAVIRCNMYVIPMGRDVVFYITVGNLQAGSGDFVTSITVDSSQPQPGPQPEQPTTTRTPTTQTAGTPSTAAQASGSEGPSSGEPSGGESAAGTPSTSTAAAENGDTVGGLAEFDAAGNAVSDAFDPTSGNSSTGNPVIWWGIGGIVAAAIAGGCVWYFGFFRKKK